MKLKQITSYKIIGVLRGCYPTWKIDFEEYFIQNLQEVIPEEMAEEMLRVYRCRRAKGPLSAVDFMNAYIENQLEKANSIDEVIDKLTAGINNYYDDVIYDSSYSDCDEYLMQTVIPLLPCSEGVSAFYSRNKHLLVQLARGGPEPEERKSIYKKLEFDYRDQLIITERNTILKKINDVALPQGYNNNQLEA